MLDDVVALTITTSLGVRDRPGRRGAATRRPTPPWTPTGAATLGRPSSREPFGLSPWSEGETPIGKTTMSRLNDGLRRLVRGDVGEDTREAAEGVKATGPVQATWKGLIVAESERTVVVEGNHYFPPEDVRSEYLEASSRQSVCPWKGTASYYDIVVEGQRNDAAAWYYPQPKSAAAETKDRVAFWHGVKVHRAAQP